MRPINLIVPMLWLLLALTFSGCAPKEVTVYVPQKCLVEKPVKSVPQNCRLLKSDFEFMKCVAGNFIRLEGEYDALEKAFEGCK